MNTFTINETVYLFGITSNNLVISVIDRLLCEEYTLILDEETKIFDNHHIIQNATILENILRDGFTNKPNVTLQFDPCERVRLVNVITYGITVTVDVIYLKDTLVLRLPIVEKHITPKQVIEHIDYRFEHYVPEIKHVIDEVNESCSKRIKNVETVCANIESDVNRLDERLRQVKGLDERVDKLSMSVVQHSNDIVHMKELSKTVEKLLIETQRQQCEFLEYVQLQPIMTLVANVRTNGYEMTYVQRGDAPHEFGLARENTYAIHRIMYDVKKLIVNFNGTYYIHDDVFKYMDFDLRKFKYLKDIEEIRLVNCPFKTLDFLVPTSNMKKVEIINMSLLTTIKHLSQFPKLETIIISQVCNIKDLHTLTKCEGLKTLTLAKGTNTGCFPEVIEFKITME